ncbi:multifunctional procollagen lysine hydroxylase and glycosyltransferase LH3 [Octopus bimaculoides]|uniref:procollagen-lysine 5-dioxygenase n=1 Tax=Octopus bimaculoides TaxID=37653 RepID=A0A0L8GAQ1_OCTBM|nr:multifunctional procollagen lysine hydroxylase and glycosyltransferase LH3 [Octopus bimaculoides]|eukprot:XP_014782723.1 PREDICTED: procollagen-lysine,2-oxoglutarate 5-dioxygenase 3-like [Octopus bimaculoides]
MKKYLLILCALLDLYMVACQELLIVTIATKETDGFRRFMKSCNKYKLKVSVVGMGTKWEGGDMDMGVGGGHKINLLKDELKQYSDRKDLIIMFTDSYDVVFTNGSEDILSKYKKLGSRVVFAAEGFCWPDHTLAKQYPAVSGAEKRFLNSGGFMGVAKDIHEIVTFKPIGNKEDDQLYYTKIFLNKELRTRWDIKLDTKSAIFQNLNGALGEIMVKFKGAHSFLYNVKTRQTPTVVHGNGPVKEEFSRIANYLGDGWTKTGGCFSCKEDVLSLSSVKISDYPKVMIAVFIHHNIPFMREFFDKVYKLDYPSKRIDLYIHNKMEYHHEEVKSFIKDAEDSYNSLHYITPENNVDEATSRNWAVESCIQKSCRYLLSLDATAHLDNPKALRLLIEQNRSVLAPMVARPGKFWSNFWGAISNDGYYARSEDYLDIVDSTRRGLWVVPYLSEVYLIHHHLLPDLKTAYINGKLDPDMAFSKTLRDQGRLMYVTNMKYFGHLINYDNFDINKKYSELWQIYDNPIDWEDRYIHENYTDVFQNDAVAHQPCPDVFWFPVVSDEFCNEFIAVNENYGKWSSGQNDDPRLNGGYENVPTIDIHMNQIGYEKEWLHFLHKYITPLQKKVFEGYQNEPPQAIMNFIVRYKPDEQPLLRPHHDSSTFTINIALNTRDVDYEGGGVHFIRYKCKVLDTKKGWLLMHPGRLTHFHEGLRTTKGSRYIMISFVDP